jgi:hypothetical protein
MMTNIKDDTATSAVLCSIIFLCHLICGCLGGWAGFSRLLNPSQSNVTNIALLEDMTSPFKNRIQEK